jgi:3-hydroxyacyl-CoA dehydrogenase
MDLKKALFRRFDAIAKPGAILASNTSFLDIDEIAQVTPRPQDVLGLHFFSPANVMRLLEIVRGAATSPEVLATAMAIGRRIRKVAVVSGVCHGFIGNRMLIARQNQVNALVIEGTSPEQVDRVHTSFGMPMGPFQMADLSGLDVGWHRDPKRIEDVRDALCAAGRRGQKTEAGYYDYESGSRRPLPSPTTHAIIARFREKAGVRPRTIDENEIIVRTMYTIVNEGAKILEEGIAQRASDIDAVWLNGYGWPAVTGGPMYWADRIGAANILRELRRHQSSLGPDFVIAPLLVRLAEEGGRFSDLD